MLERVTKRTRPRRNPYQRELRRAQKRRERQRRRAGLVVLSITVPEIAFLTALDRAGRLGQAPLGVAVELLISDFIAAWTEQRVALPLDAGPASGPQSPSPR